MDRETFLLSDKIELIKTTFIKNGWVTVYESYRPEIKDQTLIYCCLVNSKRIKAYRQDTNWVIQYGHEGKPIIWGNGKYQSNGEAGIEAFLFAKYFNFNGGGDFYVDISEEFLLYFKLYEKGLDKQNRRFYFIDEGGDLEEVIIVEPKKIIIKLKFLKEYISVRKMYFSICFDFMRIDAKTLGELNVEPLDNNYQTENSFYNCYIRTISGESQSWVHGKVIINPDKNKKSYHFDYENESYEKFITGYDSDGNEILQSCKNEEGKDFVLTYFKKEVLDKYYNNPLKYKVDGWYVTSNFFTLKIDNNIEKFVPVFLKELGALPHKEQLHWKQYNVAPQGGISHSYYKTMIEGSWVEHPETPDLFFKYKYEQFNSSWEKKYGWKFYKNLAKQDEHIFTSLHLPTSNNVKSFCEQILSITKLTIDRLNEKELGKNPFVTAGDKGITKLEKYLKSREVEYPKMIEFLRALWDLRSGLLSHSFSNSNKACMEAIKYFNLKEDNYIEVATEIFTKSIFTLNTLDKNLLKD